MLSFRLPLMGLFVLLFQFVIVHEYKTKVISELLETNGYIEYFEQLQNLLVNIPLPGCESITDLRYRSISAFTSGSPVCHYDPRVIQARLDIPIKR